VIDEPQTIPESWWQIVPVLIELLVTTLDATVILMTATQPGLIQYGSDRLGTRELINNTEKYTAFLDEHPRVTYHLHETIQTNGTGDNATIDYPAASQHILDSASGSDNALAICNTRASAEALYRHVLRSRKNETAPPIELGRLLHEHAANTGDLPTAVKLRELAHEATTCSEKDTVYAFLSGNVRPDDRALIIDALYDEDTGDGEAGVPLLDTDLSVVLISTTVVEAGVDISFDTVYRDYAPIPNIVQSGGRCNRSFGSGTGDVIVWQLAEPEDGNAIPSLVIHGSDGGDALPLLGETGRVLKRHSGSDQNIDEASMVSSVVSDFYESILDGPLDPGKEYLATAIKSASISTLENEHMIQGIESYEDVIAVLTADEQADLLSDELSMGDISKHPGSQVNTNPNSWEYETTIGNSRYLVMDARDSSYHPVYGVQ
jgi:CRISPR-associated endonuclease/helicase Cas3/CRISPR-associated endonuclease Cas3-HD